MILVVDDDFATLDFLRSILELSEGNFEVLGVPSADEGLLALKRARFDLLVADLRLPGMSGIELGRKARQIKQGLPIIIITGYDSPEAEAEAAALGVVSYLTKPLDAEDFLRAVFDAVRDLPRLDDEELVYGLPLGGEVVLPAVARQLETLRTDTGAERVVLATVSSEILFCAGGRRDEELQKLITAVAFTMVSTFHLSDRLGADEPQSMQFLVGEQADLYCANIDRNYFLSIFFDAQVRRGRIGTVWVFTRRAIKNLRELLEEKGSADDQPAGTDLEEGATDRVEPGGSLEMPEVDQRKSNPIEQEPAREDNLASAAGDETPGEARQLSQDLSSNPLEERSSSLSGENPEDSLAGWLEEVLAVDPGEPETISFEEAIKRGLLNSDFDPEDE